MAQHDHITMHAASHNGSSVSHHLRAQQKLHRPTNNPNYMHMKLNMQIYKSRIKLTVSDSEAVASRRASHDWARPRVAASAAGGGGGMTTSSTPTGPGALLRVGPSSTVTAPSCGVGPNLVLRRRP